MSKELTRRLRETKAKNIKRMKELRDQLHKNSTEWEEYHLLKHKYRWRV